MNRYERLCWRCLQGAALLYGAALVAAPIHAGVAFALGGAALLASLASVVILLEDES